MNTKLILSNFLKYAGIALISGALWAFAIPESKKNFLAVPTTRVQIKRTRSLIKRFHKQYKRIPESIGEIRLFSKTRTEGYAPYDGYATRLTYRALSTRHYIIESKALEVEKNSAPPNGYLSTNINLPKEPVLKQPEIIDLGPYPATLLLGSKHEKGHHKARIIRNSHKDRQHLIVQKISKKHIIYIAPHPKVEEYFWLSPEKIVYTATGDILRKDGIFVWNFKKNETINILESSEDKIAINRGDRGSRFHLSLVGKTPGSTSAIVVNGFRDTLSPLDFYSKKFLYTLKKTEDQKSLSLKPHPPSSKETLIGYRMPPPLPTQKNQGNKTQYQWSRLPLKGDPGKVIEAWQNFSIKRSNLPVFPYSLFWLSCLYHDAFQELKERDTDASEPLRSFGSEIASSLMTSPASPSYLNAFGKHNSVILRNSQDLGFRVANYTIPN